MSANMVACLEEVQDHLVSILERGEGDHVVVLSMADLDALKELMFAIREALSRQEVA